MKLTAYNRKGEKLVAVSSDTPMRLFIMLLERGRVFKYVARITKDYRAKYMVYWSPVTKRRYRCEEGQEARFQPVEGPLYFVGFRAHGPVLTRDVMPVIM
jgi:hypothetical protein